MTSTEASQYTAALNQMIAALQPTSLFIRYINGWQADVSAFSANSQQTSELSGDSIFADISTTVANLPGSPTSGQEAIVNDANSPTVGSTVTGGGSTRVMVKWNGSNWVVE